MLVLGGGDGLAVREMLRYPQHRVGDARRPRPGDDAALLDRAAPPRHERRCARFAEGDDRQCGCFQAGSSRRREYFDLVIVDFPDPSNYSLGKLYTNAFYQLLERRLSARGIAVIQATSPLYARRSFWCIVGTIEAAGLKATPYHALVPSFGEWGYVIASREGCSPPERYLPELRFLTPEIQPALFRFPKDMDRVPAAVNRLNNQVLVQYYEAEWKRAPVQ